MIFIKDKLIPVTVEQLVNDLAKETRYFKDINDVGTDLMVTCPEHSNGEEENPSCGILKEDKGDTKAGTVHCYTCNFVTDILGLVKKTKHHQTDEEALQWILNKYLSISMDNPTRPPLNLNTSRTSTKQEVNTIPYHIIQENASNFLKSNEAVEYMINRKIGIETCKNFKIGYNRNKNTIMIPVTNEKGEVVFYKERVINRKIFINQKGISKANYIFGIDKAIERVREDRELKVWICESEIDALTIYERGDTATAIMGSHISNRQIEILKRSGIKHLIDGLDRDNAGRKGARDIRKKTSKYGIRHYLTDWKGINKKDINELTLDEYKHIRDNLK